MNQPTAYTIVDAPLQVGDADIVDIPYLVWIFPDDGGRAGDIGLDDASGLSRFVRIVFLCPISMKPGR